MFQLSICIFTTLAIITSATVAPVRQRLLNGNGNRFERQSIQPVNEMKGYEPAGFTPEIPFELPTESKKPSTVYGPPLVGDSPSSQSSQSDFSNDGQSISGAAHQPSSVYGPPQLSGAPSTIHNNIGNSDIEQQQPNIMYGPPFTSSESQQPATVYGPPTRTSVTQPEDNFEILTSDVLESENFDADNEEVLVNEDGSLMAVSSTFDNLDNVDESPARLQSKRFPQNRKRSYPTPERLVQARVLKPINYVYTTRYHRF